MSLGSPFPPIHKAVAAAIYRDFPDFECIDRDWKAWKELSPDAQKEAIKNNTVPTVNKSYRVREEEIEVRMFPQLWGSTALGYGGIGGSAMTPAYTVIVSYENYYCVYFGSNQLAYAVDFNKCSQDGRYKFLEDILGQSMADVYSRGKYK